MGIEILLKWEDPGICQWGLGLSEHFTDITGESMYVN